MKRKIFSDEIFEATIGGSKYDAYMLDGVRYIVDATVEITERPKPVVKQAKKTGGKING